MFPNPIFDVDIPFIKNVHWYGVMIAIGVLFCFLTLFFYGKKLGISTKFVDFVFYNGILSIVLGILVGGLIDIDHWVNLLGQKIEKMFNRNPEQSAVHVPVAQGFVSASLLFCVGSMTIVGSIQSGLMGDHDLLYTKSLLDLVSSIILASTMGIGVLLSSLFVLVFQGGIALVASIAGQGLSVAVIDTMSMVGSVLIVGLGLNVMGITKLKIMNYLPAVFFPIALVPLWSWVVGLIAG